VSDQGYPGEDPGFGQQPSFGQQPDYGYGQQPPYDPTQPPQFPADQPYDPNQTAQYPPSPPPYDPNQTAQSAPYGQPLYPGPGYDQPPPPYGGPPQYPAAPPPGVGGNRVVLVLAVIMVLTALGVGGYFLVAGSDSDTSGDRGGRPSASNVTSPTINPPNVPPVSIPPIDLPSLATGLCTFISDPQTLAIAYVGAAELGQTDVAQACVWQDSVPRSVTESLDTGGQTLYAPTGGHGSTYTFTSADGTARLTVRVTRESDGNYYITDVVTG
jgi:hypothetical protein